MHLKNDEISHFHTNGFVAGPRVLDNQQIEILKQEINGLLDGSVEHPEHLRGETVKRSRAKGQLPSQKIVTLFRNNAVFAKLLENTRSREYNYISWIGWFPVSMVEKASF